MRALQKLVRNGNATAVSIPRAMLFALDWLPGEVILIETNEDGGVTIRRPVAADFAPLGRVGRLQEQISAVKP